MPPKVKPPAGQTLAERQQALETARLRRLADRYLLHRKPPPAHPRVPRALRKSDGSDITKRNPSRKKKYIFVFPGALSLPPGAKLGELSGLSTPTPKLHVDLAPHGTLQLKGSLVFPRNSFLALKGAAAAGRPVHVVDCFETLVVFSEWAWLGDTSSNPGAVPAPLPPVLVGDAHDLWRAEKGAKPARLSSASARPADADDGASARAAEESASAGGNSPLLPDESDGEGWDAGRSAGAGVIPLLPSRSNPRRSGRVTDYSQLETSEEGSADDAEGQDAGGKVEGVETKVEDVGDEVVDVDDKGVEEIDLETAAVNSATGSAKRRRKKVVSQPITKESVPIDGATTETIGVSVTPRTSARKRRKVDYSQGSGDEYEDDGDMEVDIGDLGGEGSDKDSDFLLNLD